MERENMNFAQKSGHGVHEKVIEIAMPYLSDNAQILVAGAGEGSLEYKLLKMQVPDKNIQAVDYNPAQYKLKTVNVQYCDLNYSLPFKPETFDICFAIEVI